MLRIRPSPGRLPAALVVLPLALAPHPASAQTAVVREAEVILSFPVAGVTLDTSPDAARERLRTDGFVEVSWFGPPGDPAGWNFERGHVRVTLRQEEGVLTTVERIEQGRADSDVVDMGGPESHVRSWFSLEDDACIEVEGGVACTVADHARDPGHVVTAQLVPYRTILRATRLRRP